MILAKQNTAKSFILGPVLDEDGVAKTNEVVGSIKVTKNGSVGSPNASSTLTHDHTGHYVYAANAGDFDTLGEVEFTLNSGTNAMAPVKFQVVPANVYDSLVAGSDNLDVTTDSASRTASQADVSALATAAALAVVDGNVDAILADTGTDGVKLTMAERNSIADAVLARDVSNAEPSSEEHSLRFVVLAMLEANLEDNAGKLTVYQTDGETEVAQKTVTTNASADPVTGMS